MDQQSTSTQLSPLNEAIPYQKEALKMISDFLSVYGKRATRFLANTTRIALAAAVLVGCSTAAGAEPRTSAVNAAQAASLVDVSLRSLQQDRGARSAAFDFGIIGDTGYAPDQEPSVDNLLADLNSNPLDFVVHVGDFGGPSFGSCTDEHRAKRLSQFQASAHPLIYTPGDNDWTDCWADRAGNYDALERLTSLRELFFAGERSLGQRTLSLSRQSTQAGRAAFRENVLWTHGGVTFLTVHYVTEVLGRTAETDAEFAERNAANLAWLRDGFQAARTGDSRGIVIFTQANLFPNYAGGKGVPPEPVTAFGDLWSIIEEETISFGRPVLFAHGDTHYFRVDNPLHSSASECGAGTYDTRPIYCRIHSFTRLEVFGAPFHHWVRVTIDPNDPNLFTIRPRLVEANLGERPQS